MNVSDTLQRSVDHPVGIFGIVQFALAFLAFWDLAHRPAGQVRGPKPMWIPVILVNWFGPLAYFYVHRNR